jgi:hypothetical protein
VDRAKVLKTLARKLNKKTFFDKFISKEKYFAVRLFAHGAAAFLSSKFKPWPDR